MSFVEIYFNSSLQNVVEIGDQACSIGRASYNHVSIGNKGVSLVHAAISKQGDAWWLEDMNSTNGTYLNGKKIEGRQRLQFGDVITLGKHELKFVAQPNAANSGIGQTQADDFDRTLLVNPASGAASNAPRTGDYALLMRGEARNINKLLLNRDYYSIGKGTQCNVRVGGWFTPKLIAEIIRLGDHYYLTPVVKKHIRLNGREVGHQVRLSNDDNIAIKQVLLKFVEQ
ncbi:FHA domain-containing protein [Methylomonas sp. CM2]|uniref:FHA domain-containing protein n=1 Tax=Methylomonas sp. CM2 TaxID=3417647 RepID=UPI003CE783FE